MPKQIQWIKKRHAIIKKLVYPIFSRSAFKKYGFKVEPYTEGKDRQFLIVMNHQTPYDQFFAGLLFPQPLYYVASEDLFSNGFVSRLLEWAVKPIPIKKSTQDLSAIRNMMSVAKQGGSICIFPEGNRTYSGTTVCIKPAIARIIEKIKIPVAIVRLEGGFGVEPRWSNIQRSGKVTAKIARIVEPEEYEKMSHQEFYDLLNNTLFVDDTTNGQLFKSHAKAEFIERFLYWCPTCGVTKFLSSKNQCKCTKCNKIFTYNEDLTLSGDFEFKYLKDWNKAQTDFITSLDLKPLFNKLILQDKVNLYEVKVYKSKKLFLKNATLELYGSKIIFKTKKQILELTFDQITSASCLGHNKLNIYIGTKLYQIKGNERFNSLVYMHFYYHYYNTITTNNGGSNEFLGL